MKLFSRKDFLNEAKFDKIFGVNEPPKFEWRLNITNSDIEIMIQTIKTHGFLSYLQGEFRDVRVSSNLNDRIEDALESWFIEEYPDHYIPFSIIVALNEDKIKISFPDLIIFDVGSVIPVKRKSLEDIEIPEYHAYLCFENKELKESRFDKLFDYEFDPAEHIPSEEWFNKRKNIFILKSYDAFKYYWLSFCQDLYIGNSGDLRKNVEESLDNIKKERLPLSIDSKSALEILTYIKDLL